MYLPFLLGLDNGVTSAPEIVDGAQNGSRLIVKAFDQDWLDFGNGNSEIYKAVVGVSLLCAVVLVSFWSVGWYKQITEEGFSVNVVNEMIYPFIVVLMLAFNNGALLAQTSFALRTVVVGINDQVLDITRNGVTLRDAIRSTNMNQEFITDAKIAMQQCETLAITGTDELGNKTSPRQKCREQKVQQVRERARIYRETHNIATSDDDDDSWNPLVIAGHVVNIVVETTAYIIFSGLAAGFQYVVQVSFLLNAQIGPIFLVLSLLPLGAKPIYAWLSGWLALALILVSYSIIVGLAASAIVNYPVSNPIFLQLVEAVLSPILAVAIGSGGGMALFNSFSSTAKALTGIR